MFYIQNSKPESKQCELNLETMLVRQEHKHKCSQNSSKNVNNVNEAFNKFYDQSIN